MASELKPTVALAQPTSSTSSSQPVATLKNKKVIFKQQSLGLDQAVSTIAERLNFHTFLQALSEPLKEFPTTHLPLIAKLVHECEETYGHAATRIHKLLAAQVPATATNDASGSPTLTKAVVEAAVKRVADRVNWGVENGVSGATIWRLEAKDRTMLPPEFQQICEERWKERSQAKLDIQAALSQLSEAERAQYVKSTGNAGPADKDVVMASPSRANDSAEASTSFTKRGAGRSKKQVDPESTARDKEKQDKKIAKVEKEKKEAEVAKKSAAAFASFFTPARPAITRVKTDNELPDYDKTFQPFTTKKNTICAPINRFAGNRVQQPSTSSSTSVLKQFLDSAPPRQGSSFRSSSRSQQNLQVRALMNELNDAEVLGDSKAVRRITSLLKNRRALPAKLFQFHENARPAYYGTWTKFSPDIRARRPFGKDETLDYDYDSGEDWEEEGDGEILVSDGSDEDDSDSDGEEEGWLVDDEDEVEEMPSETVEEPASEPTAKRKAKAITKGKDTKKRKVEKLAPFQKGPCWETEIGECTYDAFKTYRIQLLNDCPHPVDPFTFIPAPIDQASPPTTSDDSTAPQPTGVFAVPVPPTAPGNDDSVAGPSKRVTSLMKKPADPAAIKNPFPDAHLIELYGLIEGSEKTLKGLVEDLHLVLKRHPGVKKYAIEAKLREVADKSRTAESSTKKWRVSDEAWAAVGMTRPS